MAFGSGFLCCSQTLERLNKQILAIIHRINLQKNGCIVKDMEELTPSVKKLLTLFGNLL